jgi:TonB family protein
MLRRVALGLPLSLVYVVGCAPAPVEGPPPAPPQAAQASPATQPQQPAGSPAPSAVAPAAGGAQPPPPASVPGAAVGKKADTAGPGRAAATDAPILSKITQDDVLAAVNANGATFDRCYALGAAGSKSYAAKVTVKATVGPSGTVNTVEVVSSTAKSAKLDACVVDAFKTLSFRRPSGSGATVFTFPLTFDAPQQVQ